MSVSAEDPKKWTQARIAVALGVSRATVENWVESSNDKSVKARLDARLSVNAESKTIIIEQSAEGISQKQIAADFGITQGRVSQIVTTAAAKTVSVSLREEKRNCHL
jgi:transcriptional regulator with XRE-family HTH domain